MERRIFDGNFDKKAVSNENLDVKMIFNENLDEKAVSNENLDEKRFSMEISITFNKKFQEISIEKCIETEVNLTTFVALVLLQLYVVHGVYDLDVDVDWIVDFDLYYTKVSSLHPYHHLHT